MSRLLLGCLFGFLLVMAFICPARCYARVLRVIVSAPSFAYLNAQLTVTADVHTGNNIREFVTDVQAMLLLPDGGNLTSSVNPIVIGEMGPGPADATCNWTVVFDRPGIYTVMANVSCTDTQHIPRWLMNSTTVEVYGIPLVNFSYSSTLYVNHTIVFNATNSQSQAPMGWIVCYEWDFGDGTNVTASEPSVEHMFRAVANYTVILNVTDSRGLSNAATADIRIRLLGDLNVDNIVNILDISIVAYSYGSRPGDERWNVECDFNNDSAIDILDIATVAMEYGTTA